MKEEVCPLRPGWVKNKDDFEITEGFKKIIRFYLLGTPCSHTSASSESMKDRGWPQNVWKKLALKNYLLEVANLEKGFNYGVVRKVDDIAVSKSKILMNKGFQKRRNINRVLLYNDGKYGDMLQLFYYIRCAIAHGRFERYNESEKAVYVMEAVMKKGEKYFLRARIILFEEILLEWIDIILGGAAGLEKRMSERRSTYADKVITSIKDNEHLRVTREMLEESLPLNKIEKKRLIDSLRDSERINYDKSVKTWRVVESNVQSNGKRSGV